VKDPWKSWIQEGVGCRLQKGVPPYKSVMAKKETGQENSDPGRLWTAEGTGRHTQRDDASCKSGTAQGTRSQEI
jgi:hypothetical protein